MEQLRAMYRILRILQRSDNYEEFDRSLLDAENLGLTKPMRDSVLRMLANEGYVEGIRPIPYDQSDIPMIKILTRPRITLKGLQYLEDNSMMKKLADEAKGIIGLLH